MIPVRQIPNRDLGPALTRCSIAHSIARVAARIRGFCRGFPARGPCHVQPPSQRPAAQPPLLVRPLRQAPGLDPGRARRCPARPLAPRARRQGQAGRGDCAFARPARHPGRLPARHRASVRHRGGRDRIMVAPGRARGRRAGLGVLRQGLGHRCGRAARARRPARHRSRIRRAARPWPGRLRPRRGVHLERHHLGRAGAGRRMDRARARA